MQRQPDRCQKQPWGRRPRRRRRLEGGSPAASGKLATRLLTALGVLLVLACTAPWTAAAAAALDPAEVIQSLVRELAAADRSQQPGAPRIEEAQVELDLIEVAGKSGSRLLVPSAGTASGDDGKRPALKRRLVVELAVPKGKAAAPQAGDEERAGQGTLARLIRTLADPLPASAAGPGGYGLKRAAMDVEFAVERDARGQPAFVVFAAGRQFDATAVHKLKLKLSAASAEPPPRPPS